jgi:hypothetical protein
MAPMSNKCGSAPKQSALYLPECHQRRKTLLDQKPKKLVHHIPHGAHYPLELSCLSEDICLELISDLVNLRAFFITVPGA